MRALVALFLVAGAGPAVAQSTLHVAFGEDGGDLFGHAVADVGDLDGDGGTDFAVGAIQAAHEQGSVTVRSGRTGALLRFTDGVDAGDRYGFSITGLGDVSGDGVPDYAVGAPANLDGTKKPGSVTVHSGVDGSVLYALSGAAMGDGYGLRVARLSDADGDGYDDLAVASPGYDDGPATNVGRLVLHSGADGAVIWEHSGTTLGGLAQSLADVGDVDGDGHADLAVGSLWQVGQPGGVRLLSGVDGTLLHFFEDVEEIGFGDQVAPAGDLDDDGVPDVAVTAAFVLGSGIVQARVLSGADGSYLLSIAPPPSTGFTYFGASLATPDLDGDGVRELAIGAPSANIGGIGIRAGVVFVYSATTGAMLGKHFGERPEDHFGQSLAALADADGDGTIDLIVGANQFQASEAYPGYARVLSGVPGPWVDLGGGVAGGGTEAPTLVGSGTLNAGAPVSLALSGAPAGALSTLVLGFSILGAPFKGGTLVPQPSVLLAGLPVDAEGGLLLASTWPAGVPTGASIYVQHWIADADAPAGIAASGGLSGTTP